MIFSHLLPFQPFLSFPSHLEPFLAIETETDHAISRPLRGLKKTASDGADIQTSRRTWWLYDWISPVGPIQWKQREKKIEIWTFYTFIIVHTPTNLAPLLGPHCPTYQNFMYFFWKKNSFLVFSSTKQQTSCRRFTKPPGRGDRWQVKG